MQPPNWIIGDSIDGTRQYLLRAVKPCFLAQICDDDQARLAPLSFALADGRQLAHFQWFDPQPQGAALTELLRQAAQAIHDYDDFTDLATQEEE